MHFLCMSNFLYNFLPNFYILNLCYSFRNLHVIIRKVLTLVIRKFPESSNQKIKQKKKKKKNPGIRQQSQILRFNSFPFSESKTRHSFLIKYIFAQSNKVFETKKKIRVKNLVPVT